MNNNIYFLNKTFVSLYTEINKSFSGNGKKMKKTVTSDSLKALLMLSVFSFSLFAFAIESGNCNCSTEKENSCCKTENINDHTEKSCKNAQNSCKAYEYDTSCEIIGCCTTDYNRNKNSNNSRNTTDREIENYSTLTNHRWTSLLCNIPDKDSNNSNRLTSDDKLPTFTTDQLLTVSLLC